MNKPTEFQTCTYRGDTMVFRVWNAGRKNWCIEIDGRVQTGFHTEQAALNALIW